MAVLLICGLVGFPVLSPPAQALQPREARRSLSEALLALEATDLEILFSDQVVHPETRVVVEPDPTLPARQQLELLLAPFGIEIEEQGTALILRHGPDGPRVPSTLHGQVVGLDAEAGVAHATLELVELGLVRQLPGDGRFYFAGLPSGNYTVRCRAPGYAPLDRSSVRLLPDATLRLDLRLQPEPFLNDEIVVQSSRLTLLEERPAAPLSLDRAAIESLPNLGGDVFRAASLLPGLASNDVSAQFLIRGGRQDEVLILLDGQELYEPFHLQDFANALSIVPMEELEGAELTTGGFPSTYGDRMSGVLDLSTKHPTTPGETLLSVSFIDLLAMHSRSFSQERGRLLLSARRGTLDLAHDAIGQEDPAFWSGFGRLSYSSARSGEIATRFLLADDRLSFKERDGDESKTLFTRYENLYLWGTHTRLLGRRTLLESTLSRAGIRRDRQGAENEEEKTFEIDDRRDLDVSSLGQTWSLQLAPDNAMALGARWRRYEGEYDYHNLLEPEIEVFGPLIDDRPPLRTFAQEFIGDHVEAWWSDRLSPLQALTVEVGVRYDHHDLTDESLWSPRLSAAWALGRRSVLRASWGHFYQSQRPYELSVEDALTTFSRNERSVHTAVGFEHQFARDRGLGALRIELYDRRIRHPRPRYENALEPINSFPEIEPDRLRVDPQSARARGLEVLLRGGFGHPLRWWVGYTQSRAEDRLREDQELRWVPRLQDQRHALTLNLDYRFADRWSLALSWRYHSGWPTTPVHFEFLETEDEAALGDGDLDSEQGEVGAPRPAPGFLDEEESTEVAILGPYNSLRLADYHRLDLRLTRTWKRPRGEFVAFLDLQNLYDRSNLAGFDIGPDDEDRLRLHQEAWPGLYPSLGVSWRF